ncbi:four-carbon acid sugar kinase family protein [Paracoccus sp. SCSIO 75233]|uniref:four-carbon acid sugar kinase family protein n=1 Tax=Paracoccus sp. SCSIO 75233 TaxID=3017782 RepID=UPI0022EFDD7E|nr:four-carbon acid sugar kinase family protein [Paracoccus sp. SCSIO 75233]WBU52063.1 four-carbon acid sugar kinase family protein [Paracoccus sp. SCSIO 75233]
MSVPVVFVGDDFTGASDSLARYAMAGWRTRLLVGENAPVEEPLDALGIATDLRAETPAGIEAGVERIWPLIAAANPARLHLKICSTFDSSPTIGSVGAMVKALASRFRPDITAVIGGQPSLGRYLAFGHLFAQGPDGQVHRIDRHPVMAQHPVTPMQESDMRLHLAAQSLAPLNLITTSDLAEPLAVAATLRAGPTIFDVGQQGDLARIADILDLVRGRQLLVGASSVAEMLTDNSAAASAPEAPPPMHRGILLFAGSRSSITRAQVEAFRMGPTLRAGPAEICDPVSLIDACVDELSHNRPVLVSLDPDASYSLSASALADQSVEILSQILAQAEIGYLGIAGGDTSSRICSGLGFHSLEFHHQISAGVSICIGRHENEAMNRMRLMLKGGQMGGDLLFDDFCGFAGHRS